MSISPPHTGAGSRTQERAELVARVQELVEEGQLARAARLLRSAGICEVTPQLLDQLRRKHPSRTHSVPEVLEGVFPAATVSLEETFRHIRRRYSAPGRTGRRGEYLTALTRRFSDARARLVMPLYDEFGSAAASAQLPRWFYAAWGTSWVCPLVKPVPEGQVPPAQPDARPIAIGEQDLRAILGQLVQDATYPRGVGSFGTGPGVVWSAGCGVSIVIFGMRLLLEQHPDWVIVRIDLRNAFNEVSRAVMLRRFSEVRGLSHLVPLLHLLYGPESALVIGDAMVLVCATLTGARDRRHLACRHLARRRLARRRLARSPAPRSSAPRSSAPRSAVPRSAVPRPESPRAPVGQITRPGNRGAWASSVCAAWPCEPGDHGSHACLGARTARQDPGSRVQPAAPQAGGPTRGR